MLDQNNKKTNFWFGFTLGAGSIAVSAFLLGTKKGRQLLKKAIDFSENLEENLVLLGEELEEIIVEKGQEIKEDLKKSHPKDKPTFSNILTKIKTLTFSQQKGKKFFVKEGK